MCYSVYWIHAIWSLPDPPLFNSLPLTFWCRFLGLCLLGNVLGHYQICSVAALIARSMGPTWGPPGSCRLQMGPMLAPWTLLSGCRNKPVHDQFNDNSYGKCHHYGTVVGYNSVNRFMMTSSNGNNFRVTGPLCGEFSGHRWIPLTKASDTELWCFLWSVPEWTVK